MATTGEIGRAKRDRMVILASTLGTVFEWYDFFIYGTLASIVAGHFFPSDNPAVSLLIFLGTFGVGFGMRPIGAVVFGVLGDRMGRKYTFLVTIAVMGLSTAAVGLLPTYEQVGTLAPVLLVVARVLQGLALGGEYGGAAIYVAEHAPADRRGFYTSFIQAGVVGGFLLSLVVVMTSTAFVSTADFAAWGWRIPFLFSLALLAVSLWLRLKLKESPVFVEMQAAGETCRNPLRESFNSWAKIRRVAVALFGIAAGLTVIWYTAQFQSLYFLQSALHVEDGAARLIVGAGALTSLVWFVLFGHLSDRIGRRKPMLIGYGLTLLLLFPLFHWMADAANPALADAIRREPVVVRGTNCTYNAFASHGQATPCGRVLDQLSRKGIAYTKLEERSLPRPAVTIGGRLADSSTPERLDTALTHAGYRLNKIVPSLGRSIEVVLVIALLGVLSGMTFGPVAALLVELFPARVRYTSLSVPYHIGTGYFGGFLPFISQFIVVKTGNPFAGLWYTLAVVAMAFLVTLFGLPETAGKELD